MFNFNKVQEQKLGTRKGKFIRPGVQSLTLRNITLEESRNTHNVRPVFYMETEPITDAGFEPHEDSVAGGQIGKVSGNSGYYLKDEAQQADFISVLKSIMASVGTLDEFMSQSNQDFDTLTEALEAVKPYVVGKTARYFVQGEQYSKLDGSGVGLKLKFPTRGVVESLTVTLEESKLPKFDENNPVHFKKMTKPTEPVDDLPF